MKHTIRNPQSKVPRPSCPPVIPMEGADEPVPGPWKDEVDRILIPASRIARRVRVLARRIAEDYRGQKPVLVALLNGTVVFLADLMRGLDMPLEVDFLRVSSYGDGMVSGELVASGNLKVNIRGRHVILVDDILDTGRTMNHVIALLEAEGPKSIRICALLDKRSRRVVPVEADYVGFEVPDCFVVGYGLDFAERYRNLPFVGVLRDRVFKKRGG